MNAIAQALESAKAASAAIVANAATSTDVAVALTRSAPLTLDQMRVGGMSVDHWLKVNQYGLFIGTDNTPHQTINVSLDMSEVQYNYAVKFGNPAQYLKTYDQANCVSGGSWASALARAQAVDPRAREYRSADLPFKAIEDIKKPDGTVVVQAGKLIGHGLSTTGWKAFMDLVKTMEAKGLNPSSDNVLIKLGFTPMKNPSGQWGVLNFLSVEAMPD